MTVKPESMLITAEAKVAMLEGVIANALVAMDEGLYGDARRILKTGRADPVKPETVIMTKGLR